PPRAAATPHSIQPSNGRYEARNPYLCLPRIRNFSLISAYLISTFTMIASLAGFSRALRCIGLVAGLVAVAHGARAQLTIDITTTGGRQIPIAVAPMAGESAQPQAVSDVVAA